MSEATGRAAHGAGWVLFVAGLFVIAAYGAFEFARDDSVAAIVKTAVAATVAGLVLLFVSVLRQRIIEGKSDRYKDVEP